MQIVSPIFLVAAFLVLRDGACSCNDGTSVQDCDAIESDATSLLALGSKLKKASEADQHDANKQAFTRFVTSLLEKPTTAEKMSFLSNSAKANPVETLNMLSEVLRLTAAGAESAEPEKKVKRKISLLATDSSTSFCRRRISYVMPIVKQPAYPYEPLLDTDFLYNAGDWLDQWMVKHDTTTTTQTTTTVTSTSVATTTHASTTDVATKQSASSNSSLFQQACVTYAFPDSSAQPGTKCLFGVDNEDEGYHCIYDNGNYGSFGWCWTDHDKKEWGSCSENCPVAGPTKLLVKKIAGIENKIKRILLRLHKAKK